MSKYCALFLLICLWNGSSGYTLSKFMSVPPKAKFGYNDYFVQNDEIDSEIDSWTPDDGTYVWEHSGLFEGDIMLYKPKQTIKNGLLNEGARWTQATIPYYIDDAFSDDEVISILGAMQEYHDRTCVRFRPYTKSDEAWIDIKQDWSGCWSSVGMKSEGQIVNLGSDKCRQHGVVVHELMHAIGFYHQQSASDRDDFIRIHWDNIRRGREHNFNKYNESIVTGYDVPYDYDSVMHYSSKAFSKNGDITIEPILESAVLGQRKGLSEKDVLKVNAMYVGMCNKEAVNIMDIHNQMQQQQQEVVPTTNIQENYLDSLIKWFESVIGLDLWKKRQL